MLINTANPVDLADTWKQIAANKIGVSPSVLAGYFWCAAAVGEAGGVTVSKSGGAVTSYQDRALRINNSASGTGIVFIIGGPLIAGAIEPNILSGLTAQWFVAGEFRVNTITAPISTTEVGVGGLTNAANELSIGMSGNGANFRMKGGAGSAIDSGVALDTNYRIHAGWRDGSSSYYALSLASTGSPGVPIAGTARPNADATAMLAYVNEGAATSRTADFKWSCAYFPVR